MTVRTCAGCGSAPTTSTRVADLRVSVHPPGAGSGRRRRDGTSSTYGFASCPISVRSRSSPCGPIRSVRRTSVSRPTAPPGGARSARRRSPRWAMRPGYGPPTTRSSKAKADLDSTTLGSLPARKLARDAKREEVGAGWDNDILPNDHGKLVQLKELMFTRPDGRYPDPQWGTRRMWQIARCAGLCTTVRMRRRPVPSRSRSGRTTGSRWGVRPEGGRSGGAPLRAPWAPGPQRGSFRLTEGEIPAGGEGKRPRRSRRRMRDSNSRGVAPNTLSKRAP